MLRKVEEQNILDAAREKEKEARRAERDKEKLEMKIKQA